jgi:hypothetical protein
VEAVRAGVNQGRAEEHSPTAFGVILN